jgi:hypothetical protein
MVYYVRFLSKNSAYINRSLKVPLYVLAACISIFLQLSATNQTILLDNKFI